MPSKYNGFTAPHGLSQFAAAALIAFGVLAGCASHERLTAPASVPEAGDGGAPQPAPVTDAEAASESADVSLRPDAPLVYVVKKGDTLWDISAYFLRDPSDWPQLWYSNPQVHNPHLIFPGQRLRLVWINGHPRLEAEKLEPSARVEPLNGGIPTIPINAIRDFLTSPRLVTAEELSKAPYLIEFTDGHIAAGANDGIFVRGLPQPSGETWAVVEPGERYLDPDTGDLLGYEAIPVGQAQLLNPGKTAKMVLTTSVREATIGDRLLPVEEDRFKDNFYPHPPRTEVSGRIISVFDGVSEIPQYQVVAMNRGERDGLNVGTVLTIRQAGRKVPDPYGATPVLLPDQDAGTLIVFKTTQRVSFGLVMSATRPIHLLDKVVTPEPTRR
jgi:hypothetical protein